MRKMYLAFEPSESIDVMSYNLEVLPIEEGSFAVAMESIPVANLEEIEQAPGKKVIDISAFPSITNLDGKFNIKLYAVDDAGNQSEAGLIENVDIDFLAPGAPKNLSIVLL